MGAGGKARLRVRMTTEELELLDHLCELNGVTRTEWFETRIMGRPVVFDPERALAAAVARERETRKARGAIKPLRRRRGAKYTSRLKLTLGPAGVNALREAARDAGCTLALLVEERASQPLTHFGVTAEVPELDRETLGLLASLGEVANDLAHALNLAALYEARGELDTSRGEGALDSACTAADDCVHMTFVYRYVTRELEGKDAEGRDRESQHHRVGGGSQGGETKGEGGRQEPRGVAEEPSSEREDSRDAKRAIDIRIRRREADEIRDIAAAVGLTTGAWVLASCTALYPRYRPFDIEEGARLALELTRQDVNARQTLRALERVGTQARALGWDLDDAARAAEAMIGGVEAARVALFERMRNGTVIV